MLGRPFHEKHWNEFKGKIVFHSLTQITVIVGQTKVLSFRIRISHAAAAVFSRISRNETTVNALTVFFTAWFNTGFVYFHFQHKWKNISYQCPFTAIHTLFDSCACYCANSLALLSLLFFWFILCSCFLYHKARKCVHLLFFNVNFLFLIKGI